MSSATRTSPKAPSTANTATQSSIRSYSNKKVLITGGSGFIGSHLAMQLRDAGAKVHVIDMVAGSLEGVEYHVGSMRDRSLVAPLMQGADTMFHLAARVADWGSDHDFFGPNVAATTDLYTLAIKSGVRRFVFMSSLAANDYRFGGILQTEAPANTGQAMGAYGRSKRQAEHSIVRSHLEALSTQQQATEWVIIRPGMIPFGPGDQKAYVPLAKAIQKHVPVMIGNGTAVINTAYVPDLCQGMILAGMRKKAANQILHLADEPQCSWRLWFDTIAKSLGTTRSRLYIPEGIMFSVAPLVERISLALRPKAMPALTPYRVFVTTCDMHVSIQKARDLIGFNPRNDLAQSVAETTEWMMKLEA